MKLYATTTSERASKGQGGNDFIHINVTDDNKELIAQIRFEPFIDDIGDGIRYRAWFHERLIEKTPEIAQSLRKGNIKCSCGKKFYGMENKEDTCPDCLKEILKGKKQKTDICKHNYENWGTAGTRCTKCLDNLDDSK